MNCFCDSQLGPIYKGDDATFHLVIVQPDGTNLNFNGKTVKFIIKKNKSDEDSTAIVFKTYTPSTDTTDLEISLSENETDVDPGVYWYGVRVISGDFQTTDGYGQLEIKQGPFYGE